MGVIWTSQDFYEVYGEIPLSVSQARSREYVCGCRLGAVMRLDSYTIWAPDPGDDDEPLLDWSADPDVGCDVPDPTGTDRPGSDSAPAT